MLRHTVLLRWRAGTAPDDVVAVTNGLRALPSVIEELRAYRVGSDAGLADGNWDFAVVADFDDAAGWRAYTDHPAHQAVAVTVRAMAHERVAVQYEI
ncbi:MAG: Dabb family protein [Acidimicrobiales bacterium]